MSQIQTGLKAYRCFKVKNDSSVQVKQTRVGTVYLCLKMKQIMVTLSVYIAFAAFR